MQPEQNNNNNNNNNNLEIPAGDSISAEISEQPGSLALAAAARRRRSVVLPAAASPSERGQRSSPATPTTTTTTTTSRGEIEHELNLDDGPPYLLGPVPLEHRYPLTPTLSPSP